MSTSEQPVIPDWLRVGAQVAVRRPGRDGYPYTARDRLEIGEVERFTDTRVYLRPGWDYNGDWFPLGGKHPLARPKSTEVFLAGSLHALDDPEIADLLEERRREQQHQALARTMNNYIASPSQEQAQRVVDGLVNAGHIIMVPSAHGMTTWGPPPTKGDFVLRA